MRTRYLVFLAAGLVGISAGASAQSYPPEAYDGARPYGGLPVEDGLGEPPDFFAPRRPPAALSGPLPYEARPLPPPDMYSEPPAAIPPRISAAPSPRPHREFYPRPRGESYPYRSGRRPIFGRGFGIGRDYGLAPIRPPADVYGPGASPFYARPPSSRAGPDDFPTGSIDAGRRRPPVGSRAYAALPPDYRPEQGTPKQLSPHLQRQLVDYPTKHPAGTIIVDTPNTFLYLVLGKGKAMRYGIGVGREGFTWSGIERITKMKEWPDWRPPKEMIAREPYLPRFMAGGESNPLGARALYLGKTIYRIHGTNQPSTIGTFVSSGCIRLTNADIEDLYRRVNVGTRVVVLEGKPGERNKGRAPAPNAGRLPPLSSQVIR